MDRKGFLEMLNVEVLDKLRIKENPKFGAVKNFLPKAPQKNYLKIPNSSQ